MSLLLARLAPAGPTSETSDRFFLPDEAFVAVDRAFSTADTFTLPDSTAAVVIAITTNDNAGISDEASASISTGGLLLTITTGDTLTLPDGASLALAKALSTSDNAGITDEAFIALGIEIITNDLAGISDNASAVATSPNTEEFIQRHGYPIFADELLLTHRLGNFYVALDGDQYVRAGRILESV